MPGKRGEVLSEAGEFWMLGRRGNRESVRPEIFLRAVFAGKGERVERFGNAGKLLLFRYRERSGVRDVRGRRLREC